MEEHKEALKVFSDLYDTLEDNLLIEMDNDETEGCGDYTVSVSTRRVYGDWPEDIIEKEIELKEIKDQAKRVGNVSYDIKRSIVVKPNKRKGDTN